ncbi:MAG: glutathione S-transferase [marine bacterium B5-7]|nr:MAG: glutathione S-transferase [marine bacterium B5-7]
MKLFFSPTSPYVRKVRIAAIELGLEDQLELVSINPWDNPTELAEVNPLGKVPALMMSDNEVLFDSPVICEYLDSLNRDLALFPCPGEPRWDALRLQALADGILDAAVMIRYDSLRPEAEQYKGMRDRQLNVIRRSLRSLDSEMTRLIGPITIGQIAVACALGYLDFRLPEEDWHEKYSKLDCWYASWMERESFKVTMPPSE